MDTEFKKIWQTLKKKFRALQKENSSLRYENEQLQRKLEEMETERQKLVQEVEAMKVLSLTENANEKEELKKIIDLYICEIDHCISLIKNEE